MFEFLCRTSFRRRLPGFSLIKGDPGTIAILQGTVVDHCVEGGVELDSPLNMSYKMGVSLNRETRADPRKGLKVKRSMSSQLPYAGSKDYLLQRISL